MQRATLGVIYTSGEIAIAMQPITTVTRVKVFYSTVATAQLAGREHKDRVKWVHRQLDPPATIWWSDAVSKHAVVV